MPAWRRVQPSTLHRIARRTQALHEPYFGTNAANRFDAPNGEFGVCYVARRVSVCFAETVIRSPALNAATWPPGKLLIDEDAIRERVVLDFDRSSELLLLDFAGASQLLLGADATVSSASDYALPQAWSYALYNAFPKADGLVYMSRHVNTQRAMAIFDRARAKLRVSRSIPLIEHSSFPAICRRFRLALA